MTTATGFAYSKQGRGKEPTHKCENCGCRRYRPCGCTKGRRERKAVEVTK